MAGHGTATALVAAFVASNLPVACGWRTFGVMPTAPVFAEYLGKFCFDLAPWRNETVNGQTIVQKREAGEYSILLRGGRVQLTSISGPVADHDQRLPDSDGKYGRLYVLTFDDENKHWGKALSHWQNVDCQTLLVAANGILDVTTCAENPSNPCKRDVVIAEHIRPRFWHFVLLNCGAKILEAPSYELHARNVRLGFLAEFGMDWRHSLWLEIVFGLLFAIQVGVTCFLTAGRSLQFDLAHRPLLRILQLSALSSCLGCAFTVLHLGFYAHDGFGIAVYELLGTLGACVAKAMLMILQLLLAKGWMLFLDAGEELPTNFALGSLALVVSLSMCCEIYGQHFHDMSATLYLYQSWPGLVILGLNLGLLIVSWFWLWQAHNKETSADVREIQRSVAAACGVYFASLPTICLLAQLVSPWCRRGIVEGVELLARFIATSLLLVVLRPSRLDATLALRINEGDPRTSSEALHTTKHVGLISNSGQQAGSPGGSNAQQPCEEEGEALTRSGETDQATS